LTLSLRRLGGHVRVQSRTLAQATALVSYSPAMRRLLVATVLSACVIAGCAVWYQRLTEGNGPSGSVDLRPLLPIVSGVVLLLAVWLSALAAWLFNEWRKRDDESGETKNSFRGHS
jgi:hypothetical protein